MKSVSFLFLAACLSSVCWQGASAHSAATTPQETPTAGTAQAPGAVKSDEATIPGPLRSFLRMAGISQKATEDEVIPLLARNVVIDGYHGAPGKPGRPTEYLILLMRYVQQARELRALAGPEGEIRVSTCEEAGPLLAVLGYRFHGECPKDSSLEAGNSERAFLTIDSGFPLPELEQNLREGKTFAYPFPETKVPVLFTQDDWAANEKNAATGRNADIVELLMQDRDLARLYWAMSRMDLETANDLRQSPGLGKLLPDAPALDFYGSQICIRSGRVLVPGGQTAEAAWKSLVGASPASPEQFVALLLSKDEGWAASYFDTLSRISRTQQAYFTDGRRLSRFYHALRGKNLNPSPTRPVFRPTPGLLLLATNLDLDPDGQPHVPGSLAAWSEILHRKGQAKIVQEWAGHSKSWNNPEQLIEAMVAFSRINDDESPLHIYLMLAEMDRVRAPEQRLSPQTVILLADDFPRFSSQYLFFSEFHELDNQSITGFLKTAEELDRIHNVALRANAVGLFQADTSLWQILARQGQIPSSERNASWQAVIHPFAGMLTSDQLFAAGRSSLRELYHSATGRREFSQDDLVELLAGPGQVSADGRRVRQELANRIRAVLTGQRLASLDTLFALGDGLNQLAKGQTNADALVARATELKEFELPRTLFTAGERTEWAPGMPTNTHTTLQTKTDLAKIIKSSPSPKEIEEARGLLTPFLRDTLVGLNYAYYAPPGAQMLLNNPLFVRSHDFSGQMTTGGEQSWQVAALFGTGMPAAGGAHLAGSLADLPFVLARVEQDFIVPENVQALIWPQVVPSLLTSAVLPRWWRISRNELHAVALYQRTGEELLSAAAEDAKLRPMVMEILSDRMFPKESNDIETALGAGNAAQVLSEVTPGQTFYLAAEFRRRFPQEHAYWRTTGQELDEMVHNYPTETGWDRLSEDFGVPHPAMEDNDSRQLLDVKPFPAFMGYASRLLAESWDSNNLYWARLADEKGYSPVMLNLLIPELTRRMVEKIFASHFEDWPALLTAMHETGKEFREGKIASWAPAGTRMETRVGGNPANAGPAENLSELANRTGTKP